MTTETGKHTNSIVLWCVIWAKVFCNLVANETPIRHNESQLELWKNEAMKEEKLWKETTSKVSEQNKKVSIKYLNVSNNQVAWIFRIDSRMTDIRQIMFARATHLIGSNEQMSAK